jgi:hypothetical protein
VLEKKIIQLTNAVEQGDMFTIMNLIVDDISNEMNGRGNWARLKEIELLSCSASFRGLATINGSSSWAVAMIEPFRLPD